MSWSSRQNPLSEIEIKAFSHRLHVHIQVAEGALSTDTGSLIRTSKALVIMFSL